MIQRHSDLPEALQIRCAENEFIVESWEQFNQIAFKDSFTHNIQRYRTPYVFRGIPRASYKLVTSLQRIGAHFEKVEHHMLRMFKSYAARDTAREAASVWEWLAIAQHYGLPTRLMDWTYSPYVGLNFALTPMDNNKAYKLKTEDEIRIWLDNNPDETVDSCLRPDFAVIWCVNVTASRVFMPEKLDELRKREGAWGITLDMLNDLEVMDKDNFWEVLDTFGKLGEEEDFALFFEPPALDERISTQYALFSIPSNPALDFDDWLINKLNSPLLETARKATEEAEHHVHSPLFFKILIPPYLKWEFRDKLDAININERVLFPGLDGLSRWIKRHYSDGPN